MTDLPTWREQAISKQHNRRGFDCGQPDLNCFLARNARQSHEHGAAKTYCAVAAGDGKAILGYYTISPGQVDLNHVPMAARPGGGEPCVLSGFRLVRLAVATAYQDQRLGGHLLANAVER